MKTSRLQSPTPSSCAAPSSHLTFRQQFKIECSNRVKKSSIVTIFGTSFSPPSFCVEGTTDERSSRYLVACSSEGIVYVWDLCRLHRRKGRPRNLEDGLVEETMDTIAKKRRLDLTMDHEPVLRYD